MTINIGVIGVGLIGRFHALTLSHEIEDARLIGVVDSNAKVAERVASETHTVAYNDYVKLLENKDLDAVVVAVPTAFKPEIIKAAMDSGKHVFVEKPLALDLKNADEIVDLSKKRKVWVQVGYQRRFDPMYRKIKEYMNEGEIGDLIYIMSVTRDPPLPNPGVNVEISGGIFLDTSSHDYDTIRWLANTEAKTVMAQGSRVTGQGDYDVTTTTIALSNNAMAYVDACRFSAYGYDTRVEVLGTKGSILVVPVNSSRSNDVVLVKKQDKYEWFIERFQEAYKEELRAFIDSVKNDKRPLVTAEDGRAALEIALAAKLSMQSRKAVDLPLG
ncbi:inositol 2-dehydrogenase [Thermocladium modestius]|uniref:Inositol 2-dehydrogenase n=1 Tax=Thermocladium modestius TaxID=62609 RepID=A0A830GV97_9CREN|nr:Gfo/Idh/MocA family oxidoreductase [Thermocladium modestius]GGP20944.1 inositol 2-dehydrogenase [Thermocladium modestius]